MVQEVVLGLLLLVVLSLAPPLLLILRLRTLERHRREPWGDVRKAFLWGALAATLASILVSPLLTAYLTPWRILAAIPVGVVIVAPLVEEFAKAAGLLGIRDKDVEPEDGYIYGGAVGLGFAATENAIYVTAAYFLGGQESAVSTALFRGVAAVALHAAATALSGHGIWRARAGSGVLAGVLGVTLAVLLHAGYNALATVESPLATLGAIGLAVAMYVRIERRIRALDRRAA